MPPQHFQELDHQETVIDNGTDVSAVAAMGFTVSFAERTQLNVILTIAEGYSKEDITCVKVFDENGNVLDTLTNFTVLADGRPQVTYSGISSIYMRQNYYFVAYIGDQAVSQCIGYSVEAYAMDAIELNDIALTELVSRCIYYGDSAEAFFVQ